MIILWQYQSVVFSFGIEFKGQAKNNALVSLDREKSGSSWNTGDFQKRFGRKVITRNNIYTFQHILKTPYWKKDIYGCSEPIQADYLRMRSFCFRYLATMVMRAQKSASM